MGLLQSVITGIIQPAEAEVVAPAPRTSEFPDATPCPKCGGLTLWRDSYDNLVCWGCEAPHDVRMVRQRFDLYSKPDGARWYEVARARYDPEAAALCDLVESKFASWGWDTDRPTRVVGVLPAALVAAWEATPVPLWPIEFVVGFPVDPEPAHAALAERVKNAQAGNLGVDEVERLSADLRDWLAVV